MRKALIAAGALSLALALGACSDNEGGSPIGGGEKGSGSLFENAQGLVDAVGEGTKKAKTSKMEMSMDMGEVLSMQANGEGEWSGADSKMKMTMNMNMNMGGNQQSTQMEMVMLDRTVYMKLPPGMPGADQSKPWLKMSYEDMSQSGDASFEQSMEYSDPTKMIEMVQENGKILDTKSDQVDGQPATKYSVEMDMKKLMETMGMTDTEGLDTSKLDPVPMNIWVNDDNLPLQIEMEMSKMMKQLGDQAGGQMPPGMDKAKMVAKYTNWGEPVSIEAPPADQVSETSGMPGLGGGN